MADIKALHDAVKAGNLTEVRRILDTNASLLNQRNEAGQDALLLSKYYGRPDITAYLLTRHPLLDVFTAAAIGDLSFVENEIRQDASLLKAYSGDGWTLLHLAAFFGQQQVAQMLLGQGSSLESQSTNVMKNTPLHAAVAGRQKELTRLLLDRGANANAQQHGGWTALQAAAQQGDREIVELLLTHGADVKARADNNQSALDLALLKGHQEIAELLEELGGALQQ